MNFEKDYRIIMTLDGGGTNFVFSAFQSGRQIADEYRLDACGDDLDKSMNNIVEGFNYVLKQLDKTPSAISIASPGPADYPNGIIGDLGNLPAYRGGVALGSFLKNKFGLPVFINNDGDLYAYGEGLAGFLPYINKLLSDAGNPKRYKNLIGITLGTGFGCGLFINGELYRGDNSMAGEIWLLRNRISPEEFAEEHASIRGIRRLYSEAAGIEYSDAPSPKEIYEIAVGKIEGNKSAAIEAYKKMARVVGDAIANVVTIMDCPVVIGGGLAGASQLFMPFLLDEMRSYYKKTSDGARVKRLMAQIYYIGNEEDLKNFLHNETVEINVYGTNEKVNYDASKKIAVGISQLGASKAIALGAYAFALNMIDKQ
ncbi:ROK family protein [Melioribacter sp. Ez-97]|uniref:ROK family protein n=1 Tax=Melioribacter sp. Ez-97 TaxID=3423434 RepID=UPI003EDAE70D